MASWVRSTPVLLVSLWLVWGSIYIPVKIGLRYATPGAFAMLRVSAATIVVLAVLIVRRVSHGKALFDPQVHRYGLLLGITNTTGFLYFQNAGMVHADVALSAILIYTQPLFVALGARLFLGEFFTVRRLTGLALGWAGVVMLVAGELGLGVTPVSAIVMLLLCAVFWSAGTLVNKALPVRLNVVRLLLWQNLYGFLPLAALTLLTTGVSVNWSVPLFYSVVWAGVGGSSIGFGLQLVLLRRGEAGVVSSWLFVVPLVATLLGVLVFNERLHLGLLAGGAAVISGIYVVNSSRLTQSHDR
ncbi:MAG: DMT family transporter [Nitriliruptoraceae bacterium]